MAAAGQHILHLRGLLLQHMLHINLLRGIARERGVQASQYATRLPVLQLLAVQEVMLAVLLAEHQMDLACIAGGLQFLHQAHQRRDAGTGAHQQQGRVAAFGQVEARIGAAVHAGRAAAVQQAAGGGAEAFAATQGVAHFAHAQAQLIIVRMRGDGIGTGQAW
ncbi:hypothetical protein D3C72_1932650 [compost metagenome]